MELKQIFGKVEQLPQEKSLEVVATVETVVNELLAHFEKNKYSGMMSDEFCERYFNSHKEHLQSFKLTPKVIVEFNKKVGQLADEDLGVYLSALIQTSYAQGFNNFEFGEVYANCFGKLLKGQKDAPIRIKAEKINGRNALYKAENCILEAKRINGSWALGGAKNSSLKAETIIGYNTAWGSEGCAVEITNFIREGYKLLRT
ncbi:hypothetical protein HY643_01930 [Candidatus Woesearchaeota archaeon]|nr:hypothetical protein [Candidatus Woesearchaeota archaeon]